MARINVGTRIRYFRRLRGWSQEELALRANMNPTFLGHLERGLKSPTISTLEKIVTALEVTFEELFFEEHAEADPAYEAAMERLLLLVRDLPSEKLEKLSDVIETVLNFP